MSGWELRGSNRGAFRPGRGFFGVCLMLAAFVQTIPAQVVINEIHYNTDLKTDRVEFVELHNAGGQDVNIGGWQFDKGITYKFAPGVILAAGGYLVVAQEPDAVVKKFSVPAVAVAGPFEGKLDNEGEQVELRDAAGVKVDEVSYALGFPWPTVGDPVSATQPGTGSSIQLVNPALDNDLGGSWRSAYPTPGAANASVLAANIPPHIRQVRHEPESPKPGSVVTISAKVTDSDGVSSVSLLYQLVDPGAYIALTDSEYPIQWAQVPMNDAGLAGDAVAGDSVYTVQLPASLQVHRRLVRYRIRTADSTGLALTVPYADDPQPNFAYFVYDIAPAYVASIRPGVAPEEVFTTETMNGLPIYHLISKKSEVEKATWLDHDYSNAWRYRGTLVYDGKVYDHITFRPRGGVWRFANRKNMWKFNLNRGHEFEIRDAYGNKLKTKRNQLNLGSCLQMGNYLNRGEAGLYEAVGYKLLAMVGMDAPKISYIHFRVIDEANEDGHFNAAHPTLTTSGTQYDGDFWGLYLTVEEINGRFLDEHGLPDGNLYKMEDSTGELKNTNPFGPTDKSDLNTFMNGYKARPASPWWRSNVELSQYFGYRSIIECIHHYDIAAGKNYFYYLNPETSHWAVVPWDINQSWANNMYGTGEEPFKVYGALSQPDLQIEYQNRLREIRDLLFNTDQTGQLIDETASPFYTPGLQSFVDADRAQWDYHWVQSDQAFNAGYADKNGRAGFGTFYQIAPTKDFAGMLKIMKNYIVTRGAWVDTNFATDASIPATPSIAAACPETFPADALHFQVSPFSDPQGAATFAALQWRIAEVEPYAGSTSGSTTTTLMLVSSASSWKYFKGDQEPSSPMQLWRGLTFDDVSWSQGLAPIGWGETPPFLGTTLSDTAGVYRSFYVRKKFTIQDPSKIGALRLEIMYDDAFNAWINGKLVASANMSGENVPFDAYAAAANNNEKQWFTFPVTDLTPLVSGDNVLAIQVQDRSGSSDCFVDAQLIADLKPSGSPVPPPTHFTRPAQYELNATWQSPELSTFNAAVDIPTTAVLPGHTYRVRARMKDNTGRWSHWSAPVQFAAGPMLNTATRDGLRITEVMYNPLPDVPGSLLTTDDFEFIEVKNTGTTAIDVSGVALTDGVTGVIPSGDPLQPGACAVIVKNPGAFRQRYGTGARILGQFTGKLSNSGELLRLADASGETIVQFEYGDGRGWPVAADGGGHSLVAHLYTLASRGESLDYGGAWRASTFLHGSPGVDDPAAPATVILNEFMAYPDPAQPGGPNDWIEIFNPTSRGITLDQYYLSDDVANPRKWKIPTQVIPPGGRLVFDEVTGFHTSLTAGFGLNQSGEQVVLSYFPGAGQDRIIDAIDFKTQEKNISLGRYPDGGAWTYSLNPTRGAANTAPRPRLVLSEVMYHPASPLIDDTETTGEYIEIFNPLAQAVTLGDATGVWHLDGGVKFDFPVGASLSPNRCALIVGFDPADTALRDQFLARYHLQGRSLTLWGPYIGSLSNRAERVALERPVAPEVPGNPPGWAIVDELLYLDRAPFPTDADGVGKSLQRLSRSSHGSDPANWTAGNPTPGIAAGLTSILPSWAQYQ